MPKGQVSHKQCTSRNDLDHYRKDKCKDIKLLTIEGYFAARCLRSVASLLSAGNIVAYMGTLC